MICRDCRAAGKLTAVGLLAQAIMLHLRCEGCPCQHRTGTVIQPESN